MCPRCNNGQWCSCTSPPGPYPLFTSSGDNIHSPGLTLSTAVLLPLRSLPASVVSATSRTWFEAFWIPLVPFTKHHIWKCSICRESTTREHTPFEIRQARLCGSVITAPAPQIEPALTAQNGR